MALLILPESWDDLNLSDVEEPLAIAAAVPIRLHFLPVGFLPARSAGAV